LRKKDVIETYGEVNTDLLDAKIKAFLTDLLYRGDFTPTTRKLLMKYVVSNDV